MKEETEQEKRDFYSEGYDAALAGNSDIPPGDVSQFGPDAEAAWNDGWNSFHEEQEDPEF